MKPKTLSIPRHFLWVVEGFEHQNARSTEVQSPRILLHTQAAVSKHLLVSIPEPWSRI